MVKDKELHNLVALFDDPDEVVIQAVNKSMLSRGDKVLLDLRDLEEEMPEHKDIIEEKYGYLNAEFRLKEFERYFDSGKNDLEEGFAILSSLLNPYCSKQEFYDKVTSLSLDYLCEINDERTAIENVRIFNHIFFNRLKFSISMNREPLESLARIDMVMDSREGNPLTLSSIYFILARESGLGIYPFCFPGGMIPVYRENGKNLFFINIFKEGDIFFEDRLRYFLKQHGFEVAMDDFEIREDNILLSVYLASLKITYEQNGDVWSSSVVDRALRMTGEEQFLSDFGDDESEEEGGDPDY
ncbi:MAG: transglutaminase-like domain-containing protein [Bacteroidales bacterium]|jgi:hypothetical protein|nr:transglutaminase-like domain-containing protein [Bacteroidales bacterium]MCI2121380.1 transglutaminase-like domain-containing protein [Bacteroidales bacterium]MCI2145501.1 transglutaminase-like domain-containing protein [Bacteroidales bacterium]